MEQKQVNDAKLDKKIKVKNKEKHNLHHIPL